VSVAGLPGPAPTPVVYDVNVLVMAVADGDSAFRSWPSPPPTSTNRSADCLGIVNDAAEFALWLSPHVVETSIYVLSQVFKWDEAHIQLFARLLTETATDSGGGVADPPRTVFDCADAEDNHVLDLASHVGALIMVSEDTDLTSMSPWRGTPILRPREFAAKVDGMRRAYRR
jgi:PIN domain-containing protein